MLNFCLTSSSVCFSILGIILVISHVNVLPSAVTCMVIHSIVIACLIISSFFAVGIVDAVYQVDHFVSAVPHE